MKELHPFIFWHSDPVRPDETLVLAGEDFAENALVELAEAKGKWVAVKPVQQQVLIKPLILIPAMCRCTASRLDIGINQLPALRFHASAGFLDLIFQGIQLGFFCGTGAAVNYRTFHARSGSLRIKFSKRRYSEGVKNSSPFRISAIFVIKFFSFTGTFLLSLKIMPAKLVAYQDIAKKIIILL